MRLVCLTLAFLLLSPFADARLYPKGPSSLWQALAGGGHVIMMRHALAPGTGDPAGFTLGDCSTQRNLDGTGREQARRTGELFRKHGIERARVLSSQWCRCLETARLLGLGRVEPFPPLNSFFQKRSLGPAQTAEIRRYIENLPGVGPNIVMVTHQVNITALTDVYPSSGEIVILKPGGDNGFEVLGTLPPQ